MRILVCAHLDKNWLKNFSPRSFFVFFFFFLTVLMSLCSSVRTELDLYNIKYISCTFLVVD